MKSNVELLREALGGRSGPDAFYELLDTEIEWDVSRAPGSTTIIHGRDAVRAFMPTWRHGWEYWTFDEDFIDAGDHVVTLAPGKRAAVWTFRDGKVVRFAWYERESAALADAGLGRPRR